MEHRLATIFSADAAGYTRLLADDRALASFMPVIRTLHRAPEGLIREQ